MVNTVSCMSANYVARQLGYRMTEGWSQGDAATNAFFRPVDTFAERLGALLAEVRSLGFEAIDLWLAHLHPSWASDEHVGIARDLLAEHGLELVSLAGGFGDDRAAFGRSCRLAAALGVRILGGDTPLLDGDRAFVIDTLREHGCALGVENHPETTPTELLARIGDDAPGTIGATLDSGWFGTHGYDAAAAVHELADALVHVHLKDVRAVGAHDTCRFSEGVVPIEACVRALQEVGYVGPISIEHEPADSDPSEDLRSNLRMLQAWLR